MWWDVSIGQDKQYGLSCCHRNTFGAWVFLPFSFEDSLAFLELCERIWWMGQIIFPLCGQFFIPSPSYFLSFSQVTGWWSFCTTGNPCGFQRNAVRSSFPAVLGSEEGCLDILSRNIFTQDSLAIWIFFKNVWFWDSTHGILHSGRCPSLRHSKHECSWQRSVTASHEGWFLKPEELS